MHYLTLKTIATSVKKPAQDGSDAGFLEIAYREQILGMVRGPSGDHFDIPEMRKAMRVIDLIEAAEDGDTVGLEDADWEYLRDRVTHGKYVIADKAILSFVADIEGAPTTSLELVVNHDDERQEGQG